MKKKSLLFIGIGMLLLIGIAIVFCVIFLGKEPTDTKPLYSEHETINIDISAVDVSFFESKDCIGKQKTEIEKEIKNASLISDERISMKNIKIYDISGSMEVEFKDSVITNIIFKTNSLYSASDVDILFKKLSNEIATSNGLPESEITLVKSDLSETAYTTYEVLFDEENKIKCEYVMDGIVKTIYTETHGSSYYIIVSTTKK